MVNNYFNNLPDLKECSDNRGNKEEDVCSTTEEFNRNQVLADADHDASCLHLILLPEAVIDSFLVVAQGFEKGRAYCGPQNSFH